METMDLFFWIAMGIPLLTEIIIAVIRHAGATNPHSRFTDDVYCNAMTSKIRKTGIVAMVVALAVMFGAGLMGLSGTENQPAVSSAPNDSGIRRIVRVYWLPGLICILIILGCVALQYIKHGPDKETYPKITPRTRRRLIVLGVVCLCLIALAVWFLSTD